MEFIKDHLRNTLNQGDVVKFWRKEDVAFEIIKNVCCNFEKRTLRIQEEEKVHKKPGALQNEKLQSSRALLIFVLIAVAVPGVAAVVVKNKKG